MKKADAEKTTEKAKTEMRPKVEARAIVVSTRPGALDSLTGPKCGLRC